MKFPPLTPSSPPKNPATVPIPAGFVREMRVAAAVKWYENSVISQSKAAEIAGLSRSEFINTLNQFKVLPFQYNVDEIIAEVTNL